MVDFPIENILFLSVASYYIVLEMPSWMTFPFLFLLYQSNLCLSKKIVEDWRERNSLKFQFFMSPSFKLFINFSFLSIHSCPPRDCFVNQLWNLMLKLNNLITFFSAFRFLLWIAKMVQNIIKIYKAGMKVFGLKATIFWIKVSKQINIFLIFRNSYLPVV